MSSSAQPGTTPVLRQRAPTRALRGGAVLSLAMLLGACTTLEKQCSLIGCVDGLSLRVEPSRSWPLGTYRFVIEADGETVTCSGALPLPPCGSRALACDREGIVEIDEAGCALPAGEQAFSNLRFPDAPEAVTVEVQHEGSAVARHTFTPTYQTVQPNGPGCDPVCVQASETLVLDFD